MAVMTSAGSTIAVSATLPATYDTVGYAALTFISIGEVTDIGEFGVEYNSVNHVSLGDRRTKKYKGSYNNGSLQLQMARDTENAGQTALQDALASDASQAFKVTLQDGTVMYFTAKVMSYRTAIGSVDQVTGATTTLEIDSDVLEA